jgi:hypothetical protein
MASFQAQVEGITQLTVGTTPTTGELTQFLRDGVKEVTNRIITIRPDELNKFTTSTHDATNDGVDAVGKILSVVREHDDTSILRNCTLIAPGDRYAASDSTSLRYRSKYNPGFYELAGKIYTIPAAAAGNNDAIVTQVSYYQPAFDDVSLDNFPDEYEYLVALYASLRSIHAVMGVKATTTLDTFDSIPISPEFDFSVITQALTAMTIPSGVVMPTLTFDSFPGVTWSFPSIPIAPNTSAISVADFSSAEPSYISPVSISLDSFAAFTGTLTALSITAVIPDAINVPNIISPGVDTIEAVIPGDIPSYTKPSTNIATIPPTVPILETLTTFNLTAVAPDSPIDPEITSDGISTISKPTLSDQPVYIPVSFDSMFADLATKTIADLSITAVSPDLPVLTEVIYNTADGAATDITIANIPDMDRTETAQGVADILKVDVDLSGLTFATYTVPAPPDQPGDPTDIGNIGTASDASPLGTMEDYVTTEEDSELASSMGEVIASMSTGYSAKIEKYSQDINAYTSDMTNELNIFNEKNAELLKRFEAAASNAQQANEVVTQNLQKDLDIIKANQQKNLSVEQADAAAINQAALQDAIQTMQAITQDNNSVLGKYQAEVAHYQAEVSTEVQEYQHNSTKELQLWTAQQNTIIQQYQASVQDSLNTFNKDNIIYQAELQTALAAFQGDVQEAQKEGDLLFQAKIQDYTLTLQQYQAETQAYQAEVASEVQEYTQQLQDVNTANASNLQKYQTELTQYQAEVAKETQIIQASLQNELNEFNKENVKYQANIQTELAKFQVDAAEAQKEGDLSLQADIQEYTLTIQKFQADLASYQADVASEVQQYTQNLQKALQTWTGEQANEIQRYQADLQNALNAFNQDNVIYQATVQEKIQEAQLGDTEENRKLQKYSAEVQAYGAEVNGLISQNTAEIAAWQNEWSLRTQKYTAEVGAIAQEYQAEIAGESQISQSQVAIYTAQLSRANQEHQSALAVYQAKIATYQADVQAKIGKHTQELQADNAEYQWLQDQYTRIKAEYDTAFVALAPPQSGSQQERN